MSKHTNGPWDEGRSPGPWELTTAGVYDAEGVNVCKRHPEEINGRWEANGKFIVRACNAHDELLAALVSARAMLVLMGVKMGEHDETRAIDTAIALAKGGDA